MGGSEILVILLAILLLFGADRIPEIARTLGKGLKEVKKVTTDIKKDFEKSDVGKDIKIISNEITDVKKNLDLSNTGSSTGTNPQPNTKKPDFDSSVK